MKFLTVFLCIFIVISCVKCDESSEESHKPSNEHNNEGKTKQLTTNFIGAQVSSNDNIVLIYLVISYVLLQYVDSRNSAKDMMFFESK